MEHPDSIRYHKTTVDENGNYRTYKVYHKGDIFIFECWDCVLKSDGSGGGTRLDCFSSSDRKEVINRYEEFLDKWE